MLRRLTLVAALLFVALAAASRAQAPPRFDAQIVRTVVEAPRVVVTVRTNAGHWMQACYEGAAAEAFHQALAAALDGPPPLVPAWFRPAPAPDPAAFVGC